MSLKDWRATHTRFRYYSLQIGNWFAYPFQLYQAAPFERVVASLRDLRFLVQVTDCKSDLDHCTAAFWEWIIGSRVLRRAVNLEFLAMSCSHGLELGSLFRLGLKWITCPRPHVTFAFQLRLGRRKN